MTPRHPWSCGTQMSLMLLFSGLRVLSWVSPGSAASFVLTAVDAVAETSALLALDFGIAVLCVD